jgi:ABC-type glycerol-3-phosphate transport system permease component
MPEFGYGCAVFMQSDIVDFQRQGWQPNEIMAGLAAVLPKNIWLYVSQIPNLAKLGTKFVLVLNMDEIRMGHIFALPLAPSLDAWDIAWNKAASGFLNKGLKSGFWNSIRILVPSLLMSVAVSSICGYALACWR